MKRWINSIYTTTWNQPNSTTTHNHMESTIEKKKALTCDLHQSTSSVRSNSTTMANLNGNGLGKQKRRKRESVCVRKKKKEVKIMEKLYRLHGGSRHLSSILVKDSYIFKIVVSVFSFYLKLHNFKQVRVFY